MPSSSKSRKSWLDHYRGLMGNWTRRQTNHHDAEDAVHDAVLGLLDQTCTHIQNIPSYLFQATRNQLFDESRRRGRWAQTPLDQLDEADTPLSPDVAEACQSTQLMDELEVVLLQLPLVCRQVFLWNKIEGYSQREIAGRLGLSQSMVEKHMKRALTHLQTHLHLFQQD